VKGLQPKLDVYEVILSKSKYLGGNVRYHRSLCYPQPSDVFWQEPSLADFFHLPFGCALPATGVDFFTGRPNFTR
jgi:hypothetical protein